MLLENRTFKEVEEYLVHQDTLLIPVGSTEQHSPFGLIGTDFIAAQAVAERVGERLGLLVAPTITYGVSPHHMDFKGTATLSPTTYIHVIVDVVLSFFHHGFRRIFVINGHGGNRHAIETAFQEIKMRGKHGQLVLLAWYEGLKDSRLIEELFQDQEGSHATPSEVAVTMALRPELFKNVPGAKQHWQKTEYYWPLAADEMRKVFPDGRMNSAPWLASVKKGKMVLDFAVDAMIEKIENLRTCKIIEEQGKMPS